MSRSAPVPGDVDRIGAGAGTDARLEAVNRALEHFVERFVAPGAAVLDEDVEALARELACAACPSAGRDVACRFSPRHEAPPGARREPCARCGLAEPDAARPLERLAWNVHAVVRGLLAANARLSHRASRDTVTGVHNRAFFEEAIILAAAEASRNDGRIMFVMVDIDRFKDINDSEGHTRGDEALRAVADLLRENVRGSDLVVRYGGDEFLVVAPRADEEACHVVLDRLLVAQSRLHDERIGFSVGCSTWCPGQDLRDAIALADERMYAFKRTRELAADDNSCDPTT